MAELLRDNYNIFTQNKNFGFPGTLLSAVEREVSEGHGRMEKRDERPPSPPLPVCSQIKGAKSLLHLPLC